MLDMGFIPDIERIFKLVPFTRQTLFFSATMAPEITRITDTFLHNPVRVEVARQATTSETIEQGVCLYKPSRRDRADGEKRELLRQLILAQGERLTNGIIFCNRKRDVDVLAKSLKKHNFDAEAMHGDLDQKLRMKILQGFRDGELKLLIASDVAARGLDIPNVSHIFNFDVPIHSEDYVHRIGRTGRAGRAGTAITLCLPHEEKHLAKIEELVAMSIPRIASPLGTPEPEAAADDRDDTPPPPRRRRGGERGPRTEARKADMAEAPRREGRRNLGGSGGSAKVVGMGDHVPAFLTRDFGEAVGTDPETDTDVELPADESEATAEAPAETQAEVPKPRRTSRRRKADNDGNKDASSPEAA
jgi:superfamily II DNA/RNA helicase